MRSKSLAALSAALVGSLAAPPARAQCELARVEALDGAAGDDLGHVVALCGDTLLVGAPNDDEGGTDRGAVFVFERFGPSWIQTAKLVASDGADADRFGFRVALDGNVAVVGALSDDAPTFFDSGSVYVFERGGGGTWTETAKLQASDEFHGHLFGIGVDVEGDRIAVGACMLTTFELFAFGNGRAYVFERQGGGWVESQILAAGDGQAGDRFGSSIALSGDRVVVGAESDRDAGPDTGAAYVFDLVGGTWTETGKLTAGDAGAGDLLGQALDVEGDTVVVGALTDDHSGVTDAGSVYVFERAGTAWLETAKLVARDATPHDRLGRSVSIDGELIASGTDQGLGTGSGSLHVFRRTGATWQPAFRLVGGDSEAADELGYGIALDGAFAAAGAPRDGGEGSAYVFELPRPRVEPYGCGVNPEGSLRLLGGSPRLGTTLNLGLHNPLGTQAPGALAFLATSLAPPPAFPCGAPVPGLGMSPPGFVGELLVGGRAPAPVGTWSGVPLQVLLDVPGDCALVGASVYVQGALFDPSLAAVARVGLTSALELVVGP